MKSKTLIEKQLKRKTNPDLVQTVVASKKNAGWITVAASLSGLSNERVVFNLDFIDKQVKAGETVVIPGKVLSMGELTKKIKIVALAASKSAIEKINKNGSTFTTIIEEIKSNPEAKGIKILK